MSFFLNSYPDPFLIFYILKKQANKKQQIQLLRKESKSPTSKKLISRLHCIWIELGTHWGCYKPLHSFSSTPIGVRVHNHILWRYQSLNYMHSFIPWVQKTKEILENQDYRILWNFFPILYCIGWEKKEVAFSKCAEKVCFTIQYITYILLK